MRGPREVLKPVGAVLAAGVCQLQAIRVSAPLADAQVKSPPAAAGRSATCPQTRRLRRTSQCVPVRCTACIHVVPIGVLQHLAPGVAAAAARRGGACTCTSHGAVALQASYASALSYFSAA